MFCLLHTTENTLGSVHNNNVLYKNLDFLKSKINCHVQMLILKNLNSIFQYTCTCFVEIS